MPTGETTGGVTTAPYHSKYASVQSRSSSMSPPPPGASSSNVSYNLTPAGMFATQSEAGGSSSSGGKGPPPDTGARQVRQELDAGPLPQPDPDGVQEEVLPPGYNPEWVAGGSASR